MDRRTVVAFVGDDESGSERVARAVEAAWNGAGGPSLRTLAPTDFGDDRDGEEPLEGTCGVVVTASAATDGGVADGLAALPSHVPV
ncbi:histidine kinase, partial [Halobellus sp. Atlit-38R]